jgi:hypothetical protein
MARSPSPRGSGAETRSQTTVSTAAPEAQEAVKGGGGGQEGLVSEGRAGTPGSIIIVTEPDRILRHNISDEELSIVASGHKSLEAFWFFLGAAFVAFPGSVEAISHTIHETTPIPTHQLVDLCVFVACTAFAISLGIARFGQRRHARSLVEEIRRRTPRSAR